MITVESIFFIWIQYKLAAGHQTEIIHLIKGLLLD